MDTQSAYPHGEGEDDQHPEKISVMKRVKAKARKIRDSIKKHGPGHNQDHVHEYPEEHIVDDRDLDEEDDEEEELVQEVHGAPMHDSAAVKNVVAVTGQPEDMSRPGITEERPRSFSTDPLASRDSGDYETKHNDPPNRTGLGDLGRSCLTPQNTPLPPSSQVKDADPTKTFLLGEDEPKGAQGLEEDLAALKDSSNSFIPTNYETEVTDPTGEGVEAKGMTPIVHSFDKMKINDDQDRESEGISPFPTRTHDQFSPEPTPPLSSEPTHEEHPHSVDEPLNQASHTEKITSAAVSAKNMVASKFGYGDKDETTTNEPREGATNQASGIETATEVKTTGEGVEESGMTPNFHSFDKMKINDDQDRGREENLPFPTGTHDQFSPEPTPPLSSEPTHEEHPHSVDEPLNQASYTEKITSAAVSAKNMVASKFGYGDKDETTTNEPREGATNQASGTETATEVKTTGEGVEESGMTPNFHSFDKMKINDDQDRGREENVPFPTGTHDQFSPEPTPQEHPHSVDEPLNQASYTEKITSAAVSAKNMVASKFGYGDKDETTVAGTGSPVVSELQGPGTGTATEVKTTDLQRDQDKDVSMKSYISEKLKPGEEDKALSEVITESFKKPTADLEIENETRPREKVTEEKESTGFMNSPTKTVVGSIRGTVGSWFSKAEVQQETEQAHSPSSGDTDLSSSSGGRTLQDSGK